MTKRMLIIHRYILVGLCVFLCSFFFQRAYSESYTLSVGESVTIRQNATMGGYIEYVGLADYLDPHLQFIQNNDGSATITIKSYFSNSIIVKLVFVEYYNSYYNGRNHSQAYTSYKDVTINCKYQAPESGKKPTKILLPERIKVIANGDYAFVTPTFEPSGTSTTDLSWSSGTGTGAIKIKYTTDGKCAILGIAPGICHLYVTVGEDNLYDSDSDLSASAIVEVIEPNYPTPTNIYIPESIEISVGGFCNLKPILIPEGTSTSFTWTLSNPNVASVNAGKVTGLTVGTTVITLKTKNEITVNCTVNVVDKNGKDDEEEDTTPASMGIVDGHEYVDLGLSVNWAKMDLGANSENEVGDLYAWGETNSKSSYSISNYQYGTSIYSWTNIGSNIKGTKYDAAYVNWGENWKMPSSSEISELISKCTYEKEEKNGIKTIRVIGPNGNSIVLPYNDSKSKQYNTSVGYECNYWSSNIDGSVSDGSIAKMLGIDVRTLEIIGLSGKAYRNCGLAIRAVSSKSINSDNNKPVSFTLPNDTIIELFETIQLSYSITPSNSSTSIKWTTSDPSIATVSSQGVITGLKPGKVEICALTDNGLKSNCQVTIEGWKVVAAEPGYQNTFFITNKGSLYSQGRNRLGQLGDGTYQDRNIPVRVMTDVKSVYSNEYRTLVQKTDNSLWACGYSHSSYFLVGDDFYITNRLLGQPFFIKIADDVMDYSSEPSYSTTLLVKKDSTLLGCGTFNKNLTREYFSKISDNVLTAAISRSGFKIIYIKNDGSLWEIKKDSTAKKVMDDVAYASTSSKHTLIRKKDGTLWTYGINDSGQLCDGTTSDREYPKKVMENVKTVSAGNGCSYILKEDHTLWRNIKTEDGSFSLKQIMDNVASISKCEANGSRILIITRGGSVWEYNTELLKVFEGGIEPRDVFLPKAGHATFYDSQADYALPNDLTAQVVINANNNKITYQTLTGNVVPKGVPVMLTSNQREVTYTLTASDVIETYSGTNLLKGSDESTTVLLGSDEFAYKLSYGPTNTRWKNVFGWYWGAANGGAFQIEGHKAWLVVPKSNRTRGYTIDGEATGIDLIDNQQMTNDDYYDLQGRRIVKPTKNGVYIKNDRKVVVK